MTIDDLLIRARKMGASDVHVTVGIPPKCRVNGELVTLMEGRILPADSKALVEQMIPGRLVERFNREGEVDFVGKDGKASEIYITKQAFDLQHRLFDGDLQSVKFKVYAAAGCYLLFWIPFVNIVAILLAIVLQFLVIMSVNKGSKSTTLLKNYIIALLIPFVGGIIITISLLGTVGGNVYYSYSGGGIGDINYIISGIGVFGVIFGILVALSWWFFMYRYYKELTHITNDKLFFYAFVCRVVGYLTLLFFIGYFFLLADLVLEVVAWFRVKEIRKSYSAIA